jgi:hypothetical protein
VGISDGQCVYYSEIKIFTHLSFPKEYPVVVLVIVR